VFHRQEENDDIVVSGFLLLVLGCLDESSLTIYDRKNLSMELNWDLRNLSRRVLMFETNTSRLQQLPLSVFSVSMHSSKYWPNMNEVWNLTSKLFWVFSDI